MCSFAITCKIADTREREQLLERRALLYWKEFGAPGVDVYDRSAIHVACTRNGIVLAALRLVGPTPLPLEVEAFQKFGTHVPGQGRLMQIGGFWLDPAYLRVSTASLQLAETLFNRALSVAYALGAAGLILRTSELARAKWYAAVGFKRLEWLDYYDPVWGQVYTMYRGLMGEEHSAPGRRSPTALRVAG